MKQIIVTAGMFLITSVTAHAAEMMDKDFGMGARGEHVSALQATLVEKGFLPASSPRGYFGPATKRAVMQYQKMLGLKQTGYVGPMTRAKWKMMKMEMMGTDTMKKDMMKGDMMEKDTMMDK
ncbi:MAG: hypothetical protein RI911_962, partial [Candidatus Parcubacteria bacterium]